MTSIIPYLTVTNGRAAIEFYSEVFGAEIVDGELFETRTRRHETNVG